MTFRLADVLVSRADVEELVGPVDSPDGDDGTALDLTAAALAEADPPAELARLRTRQFVRGWVRTFTTTTSTSGHTVQASAYVFATEGQAERSAEDLRHALSAAGARLVSGLYRVGDAPERAVVGIEATGTVQYLVQKVGPSPDAQVVRALLARVRSNVAAMRKSAASSN